jgi:hypothetical protein
VIAEKARAEVAEKVWQNLLELAQSGEALPAVLTELAGPAQAGGESEDGIAKT